MPFTYEFEGKKYKLPTVKDFVKDTDKKCVLARLLTSTKIYAKKENITLTDEEAYKILMAAAKENLLPDWLQKFKYIAFSNDAQSNIQCSPEEKQLPPKQLEEIPTQPSRKRYKNYENSNDLFI